jgi:hypothetical protein
MRKLILTTAAVAAAIGLAGCSKKPAQEYISMALDTSAVTHDTLHEIHEASTVKYDTLNDGYSDLAPPPQIASNDTLVINRSKGMIISKNWAILYLKYDKKLRLWYEPHIINLSKKDTTKIKTLYDEDSQGSGLWGLASPNLRYVTLDYISSGWVYGGKEIKPFLHYNYFCVIVDIKKASMIHQMQSDCSGEWDEKNNWVSSGRTLFDSKEYEED